MDKSNIALIGMMGTMKTSIGKLLAERTGKTFLDTDEMYEKAEGRTISETFDTDGEAYFRLKETEIVKKASSELNAVISCGGGVPLKSENVEALRASSIVVLLTATPECILKRTSVNDDRPLLRGGDLERIKKICADRKKAYESSADVSIDTTDKTPIDCLPLIEQELIKIKG
ncbi:MAG: shikimate kinase [Clostridia bacterium]|nr:shikimate kinase [Clostridia bacterium]